jgi:exonuclease VII large subunit
MNLITPTDCAKFLESRLGEQYGRLAEIATEVGEAWRMGCQDAWHGLSQAAGAVTRAWEGRRAAEDLRGRGQARELASQARRLLAEGRSRLSQDRTGLMRGPRKLMRLERLRFANRTQGLAHAWARLRDENSYVLRAKAQALLTGSKSLMAEARRRIEADRIGLARGPGKLVQLARETLGLKERLAQAADPARLLALGFSLLRTREGRLVRGIADVAPGDIIINTLVDGSVEGQVITKKGLP